MIGNDVVDLADPESRIADRHARFDGRVFDATERELIEASPHGERLRWLMWAAKESAYKAARKEDPSTVFAPARFVVHFQPDGSVVIACGSRRFHVDISETADYVHAVAHCADDRSSLICRVGAAKGATPSAAVRALAARTLAQALALASDDLRIRRECRIPTLWVRGQRSVADLSLSHHGRFVAFACGLPPHRGVL